MVKIFDLDDNSNHFKRGKEIYCLANAHKKEITGLEVTQDSKYAVSTSTDGTLKIYELEENTLLQEKDFCYEDSKKNPEKGFAGYLKSKSPPLNPNNKRSSFSLKNSKFSNLIIHAEKYKFPVSSLSLSRDYKYIAVGFTNGDINILSFTKLNIIYTIRDSHQSEVYSIAFFEQKGSEARMETWQRENEFFVFSLSKKGFKVHEVILDGGSESEGSLEGSQEMMESKGEKIIDSGSDQNFSGKFSGVSGGKEGLRSDTTGLPKTDKSGKGKWVDYGSRVDASIENRDLGVGELRLRVDTEELGLRVTTEEMDLESGRTEGPLLKETGVAGDNSPVSMTEDG